MKIIYDAVIVGAGPAGSLCAGKLSRAGLRVLILDAQEKIKRKVCGEYLCPMGVELLDEEGLREIAVDPFLPVRGMKIVPSNFDSVFTDFPRLKGISLNRQIFDEAMLNSAKAGGTHVQLGARVNSLVESNGLWKITTLKGDTFQGRMIIGADGRNSFIAKSLGLKTEVDTSKVALHCHIQNNKYNHRYGEMHIFEDGAYIGIDPTGRHEVNVSLVCPASTVRGKKVRDVLNSYMECSPELMNSFGRIPEDVKVNSVSPITNKMKRFTGKNFALIGDAAGFLDPLTGEGMFNAMWMAKTLAEELTANNKVTLFNPQKGIHAYDRKKRSFFRQKVVLNTIFQGIIKRPWITRIMSRFLKKKKERADIFVGIIGNIYKPLEGLKRLIIS